MSTESPKIAHMRDFIIKAYPGDGWKLKCQMMPDSQVMAVFFSLKKREKNKKDEHLLMAKGKRRKEPKDEQLTMFDLGLIGLFEVPKRTKLDEAELYIKALKGEM